MRVIQSLRQSQFLVRTFLAVAALAAGVAPAYAVPGCSGTTTVTCVGGTGASFVNPPSGWQKASVYPSSFTVSGAPGTVTAASVTLNGVFADGNNGNCLSFTAWTLVSPDNRAFVFMNEPGSSSCQGGAANLNTVTINVADTNAATMPPGSADWSALSGSISVKPGTGYASITETFLSPAPSSGSEPAPEGSSTFGSVFTGAPADGTWSLYVVDGGGSTDNISFTSWNLTLTVSASSTSTTTTVSSNTPSPAVTGTAVTYTATVTATSTPTGTVTFTDTLPGGTATTLCSAVALNGSGQATCSPSLTTEGNHLITANYTPTGSFASSFGTLTEAYRTATTGSAPQFCNAGSISMPGDPNKQLIYPSYINVPATVTQSVATLSVQLKGLNSGTNINGLGSVQMMLVAPSGQAYEFLSDAASGAIQSSVNVTFADANPSAPADGSLSSSTYEGTSFTSGDVYPAPAPSGESIAQPGGSATFEQVFSGATASGNWLLYVHDSGGTSGAATLANGWCITLTTNSGANTTTTLTPAPNPTTTGTSVAFNAAVTSTSTVSSGTVTFTENGSQVAGGPASPVAVSAGTAGFSTSTLSEGDHTITATYSGVPGTFNPSYSTKVERLNNVPTVTVTGTNQYQYCNLGPIAIPASSTAPNDVGPGYPNPSNITASNLPGTINSMTLALTGYHATVPNIISSLLVGPAATNAQSFDFFSGVGGNVTSFGPGNLTFSDGASSMLSASSPFAAGTYKPSSFTSLDTFTASPSGFYTLPAGPYNYAAGSGASTFASLFSGLSGDGLWSLYFNQKNLETGGGVNGGWCLNFTENPVTLTVTKSHTGSAPSNHFKQGEQGATFNITITNNGDASAHGSTGDPDGNHPLTVVDVLAADFAAGTLPTGSPWNCAAVSQTVTCKSDNVIAAGSSYPVLTIPVNVSKTAGTTGNNSVSVSGGGATSVTSNTDTVSIDPSPVLSIAKSHTGTFTQGGQTATWNIQVTNAAATPAGATDGSTVTVSDTLPTGYTLFSYTGTGWSCTGNNTITCTSTTVVAGGGGTFPVIALTVVVPTNSPTSVTNTAFVYGGGDVGHTSLGTAASGSDIVTVAQTPATISINGSATQSAPVTTAFGSLAVTVKDAGSVGIANYSVIFSAVAGVSGQSGTFDNSTFLKTLTTNGSGVANPGTFTANSIAGAYNVDVAAGPAPHGTFNLTNSPGTPSSMAANTGTTPQSAAINTAFANAPAVTVRDAGSNPVPGVNVTFTAPSTGASGLFGNSTITITVATNGSGVASAPFTANGTPGGPYNVTAATTGLTTLNFSLTNTSTLGGQTDVTSRVSITGTGLGYNRGTRLFVGTVTIKNTSASTINSPLQLVLNSLPSGVTLANPTGSTGGGSPYITSNTALAPGASVTITVEFSDPTDATISYTPQVLSGGF